MPASYKEFLCKTYPSAAGLLREGAWGGAPISPEPALLSSKALKGMQKTVRALFQLKSCGDYLDFLFLERTPPDIVSSLRGHPQDSVLMGYDFHIDSQGLPRLIEVNTNASGFLIVNSLRQFQGLPFQEALDSLKESFRREWIKFQKAAGGGGPEKPRLRLIDESPLEQKMALEFFMYKDLFQSMGWDFEICGSNSLKISQKKLLTERGARADFIYNRCADFYFKRHPVLARAFREQLACFSPHPLEYYLLSDKKRLCAWHAQKNRWPVLESARRHLIPTEALTPENRERAWAERKKLFFKASGLHGGKMAYRGKSLTKGKFEALCAEGAVFQEHIPPSSRRDSRGIEWKEDFRAFAHEGRIQQLMARRWRGAITNFREEGSGFAAVREAK